MAASTEISIRRGRAYIRIIEAIDIILVSGGQGPDHSIMLAFRQLVKRRLTRLVGELDGSAVAKILSASEQVWSVVNDVTLN